MLEIHLDPLGGVAGDMFVATLIDLRPDLEPGLCQTLVSLPLLEGVSFEVVRHSDGVLSGRRFLVHRGKHGDERPHETGHHSHGPHDAPHPHIAWHHIRDALERAPLGEVTRGHALGIFTLLAEAEARVHETSPDMVEFHEVGAWDSIADIVAAAWLIAQLDATRWTIGSLPLGSGRVSTAHGLLPVPAPATSLLLEDFNTIDDGVGGERVTPTGAAILRYLCDRHAPQRRARRLVGSAHGFGTRTLPGISNCLRALAFDIEAPITRPADHIVVLECEIDDQTGEDLALAIDNLRALDGVLDVIQAPVVGKKGRIMTHLQVLSAAESEDSAVAAIFEETTTLGLRRSAVERYILGREMTSVEVGGRKVGVKLADRPTGRTAKVEADDLADVAGATVRKNLRRRGEAHFEDTEES